MNVDKLKIGEKVLHDFIAVHPNDESVAVRMRLRSPFLGESTSIYGNYARTVAEKFNQKEQGAVLAMISIVDWWDVDDIAPTPENMMSVLSDIGEPWIANQVYEWWLVKKVKPAQMSIEQ